MFRPNTHSDLIGLLAVSALLVGCGSDGTAPEKTNPTPGIASISPTEVEAGSGPVILTVQGSDFVASSVVRLDGVDRPTSLVSRAEIRATLEAGDIETPRVAQVLVVNPPPGGGTSNPAELLIRPPVPLPEITVLPSGGAVAGGSGFLLWVHGRGFVEDAVVLWNGQPRQTQYMGPTRVAATISSADVTAAGTVSVAVRNSSSMVSDTWTFTVRTLGAPALTDLLRVPVLGRDIVYSPVTDRLYVSVAAEEPAHGNSIARIDPHAGVVEDWVFVGSDPARLGVSDDGQKLYVGLDGASAVRLVELRSFTPTLQWALPPGESAGDIEVAPGLPDVVVVSRHRYGFSPSLNGVTVYDAGVPRPTSAPGHTGGSRIAFLESPDTLYGFNNQHTGFEFFTIGIDESGARHLDSTGGLISGFYTDIEGAAGRIYGTDGSIVDAQTKLKVGSIGAGIAVAVAPDVGRAYVLEDSSIGVFDLNTFQRLGTLDARGWGFDHPARIIHRLTRWGDDGLALVDLDEVFIIRSPILAR